MFVNREYVSRSDIIVLAYNILVGKATDCEAEVRKQLGDYLGKLRSRPQFQIIFDL